MKIQHIFLMIYLTSSESSQTIGQLEFWPNHKSDFSFVHTNVKSGKKYSRRETKVSKLKTKLLRNTFQRKTNRCNIFNTFRVQLFIYSLYFWYLWEQIRNCKIIFTIRVNFYVNSPKFDLYSLDVHLKTIKMCKRTWSNIDKNACKWWNMKIWFWLRVFIQIHCIVDHHMKINYSELYDFFLYDRKEHRNTNIDRTATYLIDECAYVCARKIVRTANTVIIIIIITQKRSVLVFIDLCKNPGEPFLYCIHATFHIRLTVWE